MSASALSLGGGMLPLNTHDRCEVVFDRALDGDLSWQGDHVLVLDDMLAFGRTMSARVNELRRTLTREDGGPDPVVEPDARRRPRWCSRARN